MTRARLLAAGIAACASAAASSAEAAWTQVSGYTVSGGPLAASASPGAISAASGWIDVNGNQWSVSSANLLQSALVAGSPWNAAQLARPSGEATVDLQEALTFQYASATIGANTNEAGVYVLARYSRSGTNTNAYAVGLDSYGGVQLYAVVNGALTQIGASHAVSGLANGVAYVLTASAVQASPTSTTLSWTVTQGGTTIASASASDTTAALQNASGSGGVFVYRQGAAIGGVTSLATYTDLAAATGYSLSGPSSGVVSVASSSFTVASNGTLASAVTVTPSDAGGGGSFAPATETLAANPTNTSSASFTYTPASTGTKTLSTTNTGGLTNPAAVSYASTPPPAAIPVSSPAFKFSPGDWRGDTGRGGSAYRQSWNNGAWFTVVWTASASPTATLLLPSSSASNKVSYFLNGALTDNVAATGNIALSGLKASAVNTLTVYLRNSTQSGRWNGGVNTVRIQGLQVDAASSAGAAPAAKPWVLIVGDSITEGIEANAGADDSLDDYSFLLGQALESMGYDYGVSACGYSGWLRPGDSTGDVPGYYIVSGSTSGLGGTYSEAASRWDKIDAGVSLLDASGQISAYGQTGTPPAAIMINYMTNEALSGSSLSDAQASVSQSLAALRAAAPNAEILLLMPFSLEYAGKYSPSYVSALIQGVAVYQAAHPADAKVRLIDLGLGVATTLQTSGTSFINTDSIHPNVGGHALVAPMVAEQAISALTPSSGLGVKFLQHH